jgi:hypothetical protein
VHPFPQFRSFGILAYSPLSVRLGELQPLRAGPVGFHRGQDHPFGRRGQARPGFDQTGQVWWQFGPICATSVQPQAFFGCNILVRFSLRLDVLGLSIRWLRVRVPSPSLKRHKDLRLSRMNRVA